MIQSVFIDGTHFENISKILNTELEKINIWLKANKLTINTKKLTMGNFILEKGMKQKNYFSK